MYIKHIEIKERREWIRERGCDPVVAEQDQLFPGTGTTMNY
jgi:hypothetical protein